MNLFSLILIIISAVLIYIYYRSTNPPISKSMKWLLGILRLIFFTLVIILIFNPVFKITHSRTVHPKTVILVDSSSSMQQPLNSSDTKSQAVKRKYENIMKYFDAHDIQYELVSFSNGIAKDSTSTDIFLALKELQDDPNLGNISDVVLLSDGLQSNNETYSYLDEVPFPVFPYMIGEEEPLIDVSLDEIVVNNPLYLNTETEVSCRISGLPDTSSFVLSIYDDQRNLIKEQRFETEDHQRAFSLNFTPKNLGYQRLYAEVTLEDEKDYSVDNNQREFLVSVVKDKAQFTLISSSLNWDITFIHRALLKNERFETSLIAQRDDGYYREDEKVSVEDMIADADVLILHNPETFNFDAETISAIETYISRGGNLLYLGKIDPTLSSFLPLEKSRYNETVQATILPRAIMQNYQTFLINRDESLESFWNALPPITTYFYESKPQAEILAQADILSENPVIVFSNYMNGHVLFFSGYDFYRWKMRENPKQPWFDQFIINIGQWLLNTDISQKFMCSSEKLSYMEGEPIEFSAHIFDEKMNLVKNQDIKISVLDGDSLIAEKFFIENDNIYTVDFQNFNPRHYNFRAETTLGSKIFEDEGEFLVEKRSLEQATHGIQSAYLQYIASKTNGKILSEDADLAQLLDVSRKDKTIKTSREFELWKKWYLAVIAIVIIGTELFLRKKKGLL